MGYCHKNAIVECGIKKIDPRKLDLPPPCYHTVPRDHDNHDVAIFIKDVMSYLKQPRYGLGREDPVAESCGCGVTNITKRLPHMGLPHIHPRRSHEERYGRASKIVTKENYRSLPWKIPIPCRDGGYNNKNNNW